MKRTSIWNWIFATLLVLGTATFAAADDHGSDSGKHDDSSAASASGSGSGAGSSGQAEPGDDHGNRPEAGDDKGGQTAAPDDHGNDGGQQFQVRRNLKPSMAGLQLDASGHVVIRMQGSRQRFQVEAEAMVPDGTVFMVFADGNLAGTLHVQMGEAELKLDSEDNDLPEGLAPVSAIKMVTVIDANGTVILQAQV